MLNRPRVSRGLEVILSFCSGFVHPRLRHPRLRKGLAPALNAVERCRPRPEKPRVKSGQSRQLEPGTVSCPPASANIKKLGERWESGLRQFPIGYFVEKRRPTATDHRSQKRLVPKSGGVRARCWKSSFRFRQKFSITINHVYSKSACLWMTVHKVNNFFKSILLYNSIRIKQ